MFPRKRQRTNPPAGPASAGLIGAATPAPVASQAPTITSDLSPVPASASSASIATAPPALDTSSSGPSMPSTRRGSTNVSAITPGVGDSATPAASKTIRKTRSWYGTWPRMPKPEASTQLAREVAITNTLRAGHAADLTRFSTKRTTTASSEDLAQTGRKPVDGDVAKLGIAEVPSDITQSEQRSESRAEQQAAEAIVATTATATPANSGTEDSAQEQPSSTSTSWLSWLTRAPVRDTLSAAEPTMPAQREQPENVEQTVAKAVHSGREDPKGVQESTEEAPRAAEPSAQSAASWFNFWGSSAATPSTDDKGNTSEEPADTQAAPLEREASSKAPSTASTATTAPTAPTARQPSAGSTWAFWSRDAGKEEKNRGGADKDQGEIAVIGDGSETNPQKADSAQLGEPIPTAPEAKGQLAKTSSITKVLGSKKSKRLRPDSLDLDETATIRGGSSPSESTLVKPATTSATPVTTTQRPLTPHKIPPANLVIPSFNQTYRLKDNPSVIKQIAQFLLRTQQPPAKHVYLTKEPPKVKKAIAIGVHGWFPASYLRPMIGQPTGTSIRFMNHGADAIRKWADANGSPDCEIEKIALEGDGKISERVDNLWKLLLNWIEHIRQADLIILACHSQGVPVGLMLIAKLIELGIVTSAKIGICAMAGVCLGPFADYKAGVGMLMGSAAELWEFGDAESEISKRLEQALQVVLDFGARVTFVGSIDDQLVPLDSAVYSPAAHPYIFRAVFINSQVHASDFIAHLIGFALKLRNLGISDHGLIRELSVPLAGSLYSGEGHSRLYDEQQIYDLAVVHALETSSVAKTPCHFEKRLPVSKQPNPYLLPWIMRGLLEEDFVKTELSQETAELLKQFDAWEPSTKPLKDVKWRLEAVRSKL